MLIIDNTTTQQQTQIDTSTTTSSLPRGTKTIRRTGIHTYITLEASQSRLYVQIRLHVIAAMQAPQVEGPSSRLGKGFRVNEFFYCFLYKWLYMNLSRAVTFEHTFLVPNDTTSAIVLESFQHLWKKRASQMPGADFNLLHYLIQIYYKPWILAHFLFGMVRFSRSTATVVEGSCLFLQNPIAANETRILFGIFIVRLWYSVYVLHQLEVSYSSSHRCSRPATHNQSSPSKSLAFTRLL